MEVKDNNYKITYNPETGIIVCAGSFELRGKEGYAEIAELFKNVVESKAPLIILDMKELEFLNTTGITTLGGFIIGVRKKGESRLKIIGSRQYSWQARSLKGLRKLMPNMELEFE